MDYVQYLAGCIDCDGYITAIRSYKTTAKDGCKRSYYEVKLGLAGTNDIIHKIAVDTFGGSIYTHVPSNDKHLPQHQWQASSHLAKAALKTLLPYLQMKKEQAKLAIELQDLKDSQWELVKSSQTPPYRITDEMNRERDKIYQMIGKLNRPRNRRVHFLDTPES